jgi:hypothetical protein
VASSPVAIAPKSKSLSAVVAPNPTPDRTTISFTLPQASNLIVTVKNVLGQTIKQLANEYQAAGQKTYTWGSANQSPGLYFFTVEAEGIAETHKVLVQR